MTLNFKFGLIEVVNMGYVHAVTSKEYEWDTK